MTEDNIQDSDETTTTTGINDQDAEVSDSESGADVPPPGNEETGLEPAEFGDLDETSNEPDPVGWDLQMLRDIPVTLSVEVGRSAISINNLLQMSQGSVVELDRTAGEALDVMVNGCLVAHGEVVVVNDKFGIRLTDVVSPAERVKKLN